MYIARKVSIIPYMQPMKARLKQFSQISLKLLITLLFLKAWSMSNFKQKEMKKPGKTISPSPTMLQATFCSAFRQGKDNFMGRSKFLATVTITSVPQTQKMSQKNRAQSRNRPVLVVLRLMLLRAAIEKKTPKILFKAQCLVAKQNPTGTEARIKQIILATESSNFLHSRISCKKVGIFQEPMVFCIEAGKLSIQTAIPEIEKTMETEKYALMSPMKMCLGSTLQRQQIPNKNAEATRGNLLASFMLITAQSSPSDLLKLTTVLSSFLDRRVASMHPMQTQAQVLISSCQKIGSSRRAAAALVPRIQRQANHRLRIGQRCTYIRFINHVF